MPNTGKILKILRSTNDKTQREVAEFLGISRQAYSRYESNLREPNIETLSNIAKLYSVSPQVFFFDDHDKLLESDMDIVEMIARYQLKQTLQNGSDEESENGLGKYVKKHDLEQLHNKLSEHFGVSEGVAQSTIKKRKSIKRRLVNYGFLFILILFMINVGIMTLHQVDSNYQYRLLNHSYISAVLPDQNVNAAMTLDIVKIYEFNEQDIVVGDQVVIYSDFGLNEYFVEKVTAVDFDTQTISTTYDDATQVTTKFIDVLGTYEEEASLLGTIYYTAKFPTGYAFLALGHVILLIMYYLSFMDMKKDD